MTAKKVTIKDIARELNLSVGTVSNSLSNKEGVKKETKERVLKAANKMDFRANRLAQSMARNPATIGVLIPSIFEYHYGLFEIGLIKRLKQLSDYNIHGVFKYVSGLHMIDEISKAVDDFIRDRVDIVIMCPSFDKAYILNLKKLNEAKIPVILLGTDIENGERLSCVSADNRLSGGIAGEFMRYLLPEGKRCVVLTGSMEMQEHKEKVDAFVKSFAQAERFIGAFETQDDEKQACEIAEKLLIDNKDLGGIYITTGTSITVCECLEKHGKANSIGVIATDIYTKVAEELRKGTINGVIYQNQIRQGLEAVNIAFEYISRNFSSINDLKMIIPQLVLGSSIGKYEESINMQIEDPLYEA